MHEFISFYLVNQINFLESLIDPSILMMESLIVGIFRRYVTTSHQHSMVLISISYLLFSCRSRRVYLLKIGSAIESPYP